MNELFSIPQPIEVSDVLMVFPGQVDHLMPPESKFTDDLGQEDFRQLASDWFYHGITIAEEKTVPRPGIDLNKAYRHLRCVLGSYQFSQEYKINAIALLCEAWFEQISWSPGNMEVLRVATS